MDMNLKPLHQALMELENAVAAIRAGGPRADLPALFAKIDRLGAGVSAGAPELSHFLQRKSYQKAREWIEARSGGGTGTVR